MSQLFEKDPDAEKDWGQEEKKATQDEMVGWHHWFSGYESEPTLGDSEGQVSLACCSSWGCTVTHVVIDLLLQTHMCIYSHESEVAQSCPILCGPMNCSPSGSSVHGIFQARVLEWVAMAFSTLKHTFKIMHFQHRKYENGGGESSVNRVNLLKQSWTEGPFIFL